MRTIGAAKFKANCLAVLDEVQSKREPVLVTKNGKPIAKMVPLDLADEDPWARFRFPGQVIVTGDITSPIHSDQELEEFERNSVEQLNDRG